MLSVLVQLFSPGKIFSGTYSATKGTLSIPLAGSQRPQMIQAGYILPGGVAGREANGRYKGSRLVSSSLVELLVGKLGSQGVNPAHGR